MLSSKDPELIFLTDGASKGVMQIFSTVIPGDGDGLADIELTSKQKAVFESLKSGNTAITTVHVINPCAIHFFGVSVFFYLVFFIYLIGQFLFHIGFHNWFKIYLLLFVQN